MSGHLSPALRLGVPVGLVEALGLGGLPRGLLFGVRATLRATAVDPMVALRSD